jgi:hypothetical protein
MSHKAGRLGSLFGRKNRAEVNQGLPYRVRDDYLSPQQTSFFKMLLKAAGDTFVIIPRVNLSDIFLVLNTEKNQNILKSISQKRIDFLLCDPHTMQPLVGVELDEQSDQIMKSPEQEVFMDDIFEAAKLPLVRIFISNPNNLEDLRECLFEAAGRCEPIEISTDTQNPPETELDGEPGINKTDESLPPHGLTGPSLLMGEPRDEHAVQVESPVKQPELYAEEPVRQPELRVDEPLGQPELQAEEPEPVQKPGEPQWDPAVGNEEPVSEPVLPEFSPDLQAEGNEEDMAAASGSDAVEEQPVPIPVVRRFLNSQPEQTPGVDFFTGSVSDLEPPVAAHMEVRREPSADESLGAEVSAGASQAANVPDTFERDDKASAGSPADSTNLEQLKERMKQEVEQAAQAAVQSGAPACPRCNATMVLRTSKRGHQFYVCASYPYCREVRGLYE